MKGILAYQFEGLSNIIPANIYLFKDSSGNTRKRCEICSKLTIKTPSVTVSLLLALNMLCIFFSVSIVDFEEVFVCWGCTPLGI